MKNNKGITLIALVVTIIVLLILAGVTITMLTGDTGLMSKSEKTVYMSRLADEAEKIGYFVSEALADEYSKVYANETKTTTIGDTATTPAVATAIVTGIQNAYLVKDPLVEYKVCEATSTTVATTPTASVLKAVPNTGLIPLGEATGEYTIQKLADVADDAKTLQLTVVFNGHYKTAIVTTSGLRWFEVDTFKVDR